MASMQDLEAARAVAEEAARLILDYYQRWPAVSWAPPEVSTEADRQAQELIFRQLSARFPADAFVGEERTALSGQLPRHGDRLWIVDPIDGTRGFVQKNGEFAVLIALVEHGEATLGLVLEPVENRCTWAVREKGCWTEQTGQSPRPCRVSDQSALDRAILVRSRAEKKTGPRSLLPTRQEMYTYSAGRKLALVARGEADVYASLFQGFHAWDVCAGHVLVSEAGGRLTDALGQEIGYSDPSRPIAGLIAANPELHRQALAHLRPRMQQLLQP